MITKDTMSLYLDKFSLLVPLNVWRTVRRICVFISGLKGLISHCARSLRHRDNLLPGTSHLFLKQSFSPVSVQSKIVPS